MLNVFSSFRKGSTIVNTIKNLQVPQEAKNILIHCATTSFSRRALIHGVYCRKEPTSAIRICNLYLKYNNSAMLKVYCHTVPGNCWDHYFTAVPYAGYSAYTSAHILPDKRDYWFILCILCLIPAAFCLQITK